MVVSAFHIIMNAEKHLREQSPLLSSIWHHNACGQTQASMLTLFYSSVGAGLAFAPAK